MLSSRTAKWILLAFLILFALYAVYPPVRVAKRVEQISEKPGEVPKVEVRRDVWWLPLKSVEPKKEVTIVRREPDGTVVRVESTYVDGRIRRGLDIAGGFELLFQAKSQEGELLKEEKVSQTIKNLRQRIDPQNIKEFDIQALGNSRILIQVPKASRAEVDRLKALLVRMGRLEFKLALPRTDTYSEEYERAKQGLPVSGYKKMYVDDDESKPFYLIEDRKARVTGELLSRVNPTWDDRRRPAVGFQFNARGAKMFGALTGQYGGWLLAIVLDGTLRSAPRIEEQIRGKGIIRGTFTQEEVNDLVTILQAGSLPVDLELLQESSVDPRLGRDSIIRGIRAILAAGLIVLVFIAIYYLSCGLVADAALLLNLVLLAGVLGFLGAALTLPGVAGVLLTLGMAVDANILIFERIREESAGGKSIQVALRNGYDKAYTTIIDANVTTLLTAFILYLVGTGPVRGFAFTLSAGIVLSMFTALFVTRLVFETLVARGWLKEFRMLTILRRPAARYSLLRRPAFLCSGIVVLVGVIAFFGRGSDLYDIDFTGGSLVRVWLGKPTAPSEVRERLAAAGMTDADVQGYRSPHATAEGTTDFAIRFRSAGDDEFREAFKQEVQERLVAATLFDEKQEVGESPDGRGLEVKFKKPVDEMTLRQALAGPKGDPFKIEHMAEVTPEGDLTTGRIVLRLAEKAPLAQPRELWMDMLAALAGLGLSSRPCTLELGEVTPPAQEGAPARLDLTTDRPISWQLLASELSRREFPQVHVEEEPQPTTRFVLTGTPDVLGQFKREMADQTVNIPEAVIDGLTVTGTLALDAGTSVTEGDVRRSCEQWGLGRVLIVALDGEFESYTIALSYERIKETMESALADLGTGDIDVEFHALDEPVDARGWTAIEMALSRPLTLPVVQHYLEEAGFGTDAQDMIADTLPPHVATSRVTLRLPAARVKEAQDLIEASLSEPHLVQRVDSIAGKVAREMKGRALLAVICAAVVIVFYVAVRFHAFRFGVAAVIALIHDILITVGLVALADWSGAVGNVKINLPMLAALLTVMGYSLNDTIVVFDRIRENMAVAGRRAVSAEIIDSSINQVLSRTILTSLTTLAVVAVLYLLGGPVLQGLAFTLIVGVVVGTYSSIFIASPVLLDWPIIARLTRGFFRMLFLPLRAPFMLARALRGAGVRS